MSNVFGPDTGAVPTVRPGSTPAGTGGKQQQNLEEAPTSDTGGNPTELLDRVEDRGEAAQLQFPSVAGQPGVEVAERSADVSKGATKRHRKVFRVFIPEGVEAFPKDTFDHGPNRVATRQYMTGQGLRPVGDVALVSAEPFDERNIDLAYEVEAVPAAIATDPATAHVVVSTE